jgi:superfamily I DNA and/or RNA helicase
MNAAEILKNHRQHYVTRLVSRNPLLKFLPNAYREDLTNLVKLEVLELEKQIQPVEILKLLLAKSPKSVKIQNAQKKNLARCTKIKNESDDYFHATGQLSFYLGFPFVHVTEASRYQFSPLFLWAITCKISGDAIIFERANDEDGNPLEPQLNRIFQTWLNYETGVHLNWDNGENLNWDTIEEETKIALSAWRNCNIEFDTQKIQPIPDKETLKIPLPKARVLSCSVLGYVPFKGQALLDDLDKLAEQLQNGESNRVLDYFLKPVDLSSVQENAPKPNDNDKWLVTDYDHSQESVVWNTRKFDLMVLQGPPGTGKSQVIVNLIADAVANKKKVLVVCQKKAALEVIRKRLTANGLGDLVQLIEDPQNDRMRIIKSIREIETNFSTHSELAIDRNKTSNSLVECETFLDKTNAILSKNKNGKYPNYGNLKARLYQLAQEGIDAYGQLSLLYQKTLQSSKWLPDTKKELQLLLEETKEFLQQYQSCNYSENPYRNLEQLPENPAELRGIVNKLNGLAQFLENSDGDFYSSQNTWLAEHDWATHSYASFLSPGNQQTYKNFRYLAQNTYLLNKWFPKNYTNELLVAARKNKQIDKYSQLKALSGSIDQVLFVKNKLNEQTALNFLFNNSPELIEHWQKIIECFRFQAWLDDLTKESDISKFAFEEKKNKLKQALLVKCNQDVQDIRSKYSHRIQARNDLTDRNLLRLKKSNNAPKTTLRKLYNAGFESVHQLQPVLLTNPEGVSAVLELSPNLYDLVVIDEASQMFMADALPILYRAKAAFLSGDSQQMPPSDFFSSVGDIENADDEYEDEDDDNGDKTRLIAADGEYCLLDAAEYAVKKGNPNHAMLSVHYRSEFKELIDFSNHAFYEGKLIASVSNKICPSVIKSPIEVILVENATAKAGANPTEAVSVVNRIVELWQQQDTLSLGVITLNIKQKDQIDDLLFERGRQDSKFLARLEQERNRTKDGEDVGFFVRSVEHVQGDERDLIIFSTVYDGSRRNYGAISRKEKGRKRLNVAVTRAKLGMIIYTSLSIDAISNESQRDESESYWFWQYMRYAKAVSDKDAKMTETILKSLSGKNPLPITDAEPDSFFEEDVADFLREKNYHVDYQIGESGFKIDLGVKRNIQDTIYLCGIECDGRQYHNSWSARLNDIWRQDILEKKGWKIIRIWSNDWFDNREEAQTKLLADLKML